MAAFVEIDIDLVIQAVLSACEVFADVVHPNNTNFDVNHFQNVEEILFRSVGNDLIDIFDSLEFNEPFCDAFYRLIFRRSVDGRICL